MAKKIITVIIILVLITGVGIGVYLVQRNMEIREKAAPATNMSLSADDSSPTAGQDFSVLVNINTGTNQVIGAELYINYDPTKLEAKSVAKGTFLPNPQAIGPTIDPAAGKISYTLYLFPGSTPVSGQGTLAVITFNAKSSGSTQVTFAPDNKVAAVQEGGQNVLVGTTPITINIQSGQTAQPTLTPVPNATSTPTHAPTPTTGQLSGNNPTSTPTATPTSTPVPTATVNPLGGVQETPTAIPTRIPTSNPTLYNPAAAGGDTSLPDSGIPLPTIAVIASFILIIVFASLLAL